MFPPGVLVLLPSGRTVIWSADLDGDGALELIVFMIDNPPGINRGLYRIGHKLDANGNVTGGWTPWTEVPDWFSWENQGAGVLVRP